MRGARGRAWHLWKLELDEDEAPPVAPPAPAAPNADESEVDKSKPVRPPHAAPMAMATQTIEPPGRGFPTCRRFITDVSLKKLMRAGYTRSFRHGVALRTLATRSARSPKEPRIQRKGAKTQRRNRTRRMAGAYRGYGESPVTRRGACTTATELAKRRGDGALAAS